MQTLIQTVLSPVLVVQAFHARARALQMPEAEGPRGGIVGVGPILRLLVIGDSAAAGVGVSTQDDALLGHLTRRLAQVARVEFDLVARTGAKTSDVLTWLDDLPRQQYDVVVTSLGVNDVTKAVPRRRWLAQQARLIDRFVNDLGVRRIVMTGLPPMGRFPLLPQPLRWVLGRRAAAFDAGLIALIADRPCCSRVAVDPMLDPNLMAEDGFHPGPQVHAQWAKLAAEAILADRALLDAAQVTA